MGQASQGPAGALVSPVRSSTVVSRPVVAVDELRRAWKAVEAGEFRNPRRSSAPEALLRTAGADPSRPAHGWVPAPDEDVVLVFGCHGGSGASTLALAVATAAAQLEPSRVVECRGGPTAGLSTAATAELGIHPSGWRQGRREDPRLGRKGATCSVLIERPPLDLTSPDALPTPTPLDSTTATDATDSSGPAAQQRLTVVDAGWDLQQCHQIDGWLGPLTRSTTPIVLVATASVPGLRRLEAALELLKLTPALQPQNQDPTQRPTQGPTPGPIPGPTPARPVVAALTLRTRRLPGSLRRLVGPRTHGLWSIGDVLVIPSDRRLSISGIDSVPLPRPLLDSARHVLDAALPATPTRPAPDRNRGDL